MKKLFLIIILSLLLVVSVHAQENSGTNTEPKFGVKAGFSSLALKVSALGASVTENLSGFYVGGFAEFYLSDDFDFQPELVYGNYSQDGESSDVLLIPLLAKYKPTEKLSFLAGPQLDYLLNSEDSEGLKRLGFGLALGASYDITNNVIIDARYTFGLSNRIDDIDEFEGFDVKAKFSYFQVGLAYRF